MYQLYRLISWLIYPGLLVLLYLRVLKGKEDKLHFKEKLGISAQRRPSGKLIWFHAASVGEFNAILPVINSVPSKTNILVTTVTLSAASIAKQNLPKNAIHQFMPFDAELCVRRFLKLWQPDLIIWTESEIWPNIIMLSKPEKILINARISENSFKRWKFFKNFAKQILESFAVVLAQSEETKNYLARLGVNSEYLGNLKYVANNFSFSEKDLEFLKDQTSNRIILMAASTHPGEELMFKFIHENLKKKFPELLTIIAPRHLSRINDVLDDLKGLKLVLRSENKRITDTTDMLVVDTMGEFGLFFRISQIVATGGSWKRIAHSFLEAAKLDNLIIVGPNTENSREVAQNFIARKAALYAENEQEILTIVENYCKDKNQFKQYLHNSKEIVEEMGQVKDKIMAKIAPYVDKL